MLFLLFIHFLAFPAYGEFSIINQAITDPMVFAQSFSSASPKQIENVIDIIKGLIRDGKAKNDSIVEAHDAALKAQATAVAKEKQALGAFELATGKRKTFAADVEATKSLLAKNQAAQKAALAAFNVATQEKNTAQSWMEDEVKRINKEKAILEGVIDTLEKLPSSLIGTERNLLSLQSHLAPIIPALIADAKVNPTTVSNIVKMVKAIISKGEDDRTNVIADRDSAEKVRVNKEKAHKEAVKTTLGTQERLEAEEKKLKSLVEGEKAAKSAWKVTEGNLTEANKDVSMKKKEMDTQVPILNKEDAQLNKVVSILDGMLPKK